MVAMYLTSLTILFLGGNWRVDRVPVELARDTPDSYGNVKSRKHGMIDNRAGLTISTKAIGAAEQNWMLEVSDGGRNSITSESDNLFTIIYLVGTLLKLHGYRTYIEYRVMGCLFLLK